MTVPALASPAGQCFEHALASEAWRDHLPREEDGADVDPKLQAAVDALVEYAKPEAVLLFGSRARGDFDEWSDWDLFVIVPDDAPIRSLIPSVLQDLAWERARFPVDAVACCRSIFEAKKSDPNSLSHDVARDGVLLYGHLAP